MMRASSEDPHAYLSGMGGSSRRRSRVARQTSSDHASARSASSHSASSHQASSGHTSRRASASAPQSATASASQSASTRRRSVWERLGLTQKAPRSATRSESRSDARDTTTRTTAARSSTSRTTAARSSAARSSAARSSTEYPRADGYPLTDDIESAEASRESAVFANTYRADGGDPSATAWRRFVNQFKHCLDMSDDEGFQPISTARYTGRRFFLNPVYCYFGFVACAVTLTVMGLIMVYSSSSVELVTAGSSPLTAALNQLKFIAAGGLLMGCFLYGNERFHQWLVIGFSSVALALQFFTCLFGVEFQGNKSWINLGGIQFQPAEFLKLSLCAILPVLVYNAARTIERNWLIAWAVPILVAAFAILLVGVGSGDMGTSLVLVAISLGVLFIGGIPLDAKAIAAIVGVIAVAAAVLASNSSRTSRIATFLHRCSASDADTQGSCYQVIHGIYALSSGGVGGVGLGNSYEKWNYLPEAESDYIFAVIGEELGFVGALFVIILFILMGWCLIVMAINHPRFIGGLTMIGVFFWIIPQALINIAVVLELFPVAGLPLPFLSSGGSSLISCLGACGLVCYEARRIPAVHDVVAR